MGGLFYPFPSRLSYLPVPLHFSRETEQHAHYMVDWAVKPYHFSNIFRKLKSARKEASYSI